MNIKMIIILKCFGIIFGLTIYNFLYENFINDIILDSLYKVKDHFGNSTIKLPDSN